MNTAVHAGSDHAATAANDGAITRGRKGHRWLKWPDTVLVGLVEALAAVLVLIEIVVLLAGVIARFALHAPLLWSDELASILFLWLAMLGAAVALRRGEHMRMTALAGARPVVEAVAIAACLAFLAMVAWPSWEYAADEVVITTPALGISNAWRAAALPVGIVLMTAFALLRLLRESTPRQWLVALVLVVGIVLVFWLASPLFRGLGRLNLLVFFVGVAAGSVLAGIPIAFAFGLGTFGYLALATSTPLPVMVGRMDEGMSHLILLSVPLFVFLGLLIEMTGMARAMVNFLASLLGHVRGGLSYVLLGAMYLVSGISGSKAADMAAIAPALFPEMKKRGAKEGELVALLAATGAQTETVPPSLVLITIGSVTGVSIAALFTGGLLPALVLGLMLCVVVWFRYQWELAQRDVLISPGDGSTTYYGSDRVWPFVIVGTHPYASLLRQIVNENGSDGTVRVCAANLNARGVTLDFRTGAQNPVVLWGSRLECDVPLAVLPTRTHGSIIDPDRADRDNREDILETNDEKQQLGRLILQALSCKDFDT